jgi:hypothetical protein
MSVPQESFKEEGRLFIGAPKMILDDFRQSLASTQPPAGLTLALAGL